MSPLISAVGVRKGFGKGSQRIEVLKGVDLEVDPGEFVAIVGSSGAGKSTLLYCLCGLLAADGGSITLAGNDLGPASRSELARIRRGYLPGPQPHQFPQRP